MAELEADLDHIIPSSVLPPFWAKLVVGFVSLLCFARSYDGDFVFDDSEAIVNNKVCILIFFLVNLTTCLYLKNNLNLC